MISLVGDNWTELQREICEDVHRDAGESNNVQFKLTNPRSRVSGSRLRNVDYGVATGKFFWDFDASADVNRLAYYNRRVRDIAVEDLATGYFWRAIAQDTSQWEAVVGLLRTDPQARNAVMFATNGSMTQFIIKDNRLNMRVASLNDDVVWRLPYDVFTLTLFQEVMLLELRTTYSSLDLGDFVYTSGAVWRSVRHTRLIELMATEEYNIPEPMLPILSLIELDAASDMERSLRERHINTPMSKFSSQSGVPWLVSRLVDHRLKREEEMRPNAQRAAA